VLHTIEHLFATYVRSGPLRGNIIYFGPMGCRTGFYFITRGISHSDAVALTKEALAFISDYDGEIPGSTESECGNYREHDLAGARKWSAAQLKVLEGWDEALLDYKHV
jgi:S-ribosylhomocysteine lyase